MKDVHNRYREEELEEQEKNGTVEEKFDDSPQKEPLSEVDELKLKLEEKNNDYLRALAELENYKKRINEERNRERKYAYQSLLEELIAGFDIFDKALNMKTDNEELKNFLLGFQMINKNFKDVLEKNGVKKINALGEKFDPRFHHAVETTYDENVEEGLIIQEMQTGYMYKDRVLRVSLVKVNQKPKEESNQ
ncbi:MAG: nucleotide exchange factor GrpE [Bacilli bacterium]|nr:nucleotide exchange factor GrpE [Bacilli bacterium]